MIINAIYMSTHSLLTTSHKPKRAARFIKSIMEGRMLNKLPCPKSLRGPAEREGVLV